MKPRGGGAPSGDLASAIDRDLGGLAKFKDDFKAAAVGQFGSGWAWLVADQGKLRIDRTPNAVNPLAQGQTALLTCDVWEHAYYLDFQNRRPDFVQAFLDHLINWDFVRRQSGEGALSPKYPLVMAETRGSSPRVTMSADRATGGPAIEQHRGVLAVGHANRLGAGEPGERNLRGGVFQARLWAFFQQK